jgi:hypothetical protein
MPHQLPIMSDRSGRKAGTPWSDPIARMFPPAEPGKRGVPRLAAPPTPPDPPQWPACKPY